MSISNITKENNFDLYCHDLTVSNSINVDSITMDSLVVNEINPNAEHLDIGSGSVTVTGALSANNLTATFGLTGTSATLTGEELSPGSAMKQAVRLDADVPMVMDVNTNQNVWSPAINFYGKENIDRSLYFYGGTQSGNQKQTDWQQECSLKVNENVVVQNADLVLFDSPAPSTLEQRQTEKKIIFNYGDDGLDNSQTCNIGMVGGTNGVQGNIIFRAQNSDVVPGSTLKETMRIKGEAVGILTDDPICALQVDSEANFKQLSMAGVLLPTPSLCARFKSPGADADSSGQLFIEAGKDGGNERSGWSTLSWNGYLNGNDIVVGGYKRIDEDKQIWQMRVDQRITNDSFTLSSLTPTDPFAPQTIYWIMCDGDVGMQLNQQIQLDATPSTQVVRPTFDNEQNLGYTGYAWKDIFSVNAVTVTSDLNKKKEISNLSKGLEFINALRPVEYKFKENNTDKEFILDKGNLWYLVTSK